jgi:BirA family biotin operon repressor/biotin-[acetyl-CoA-carboxylase] ligase
MHEITGREIDELARCLRRIVHEEAIARTAWPATSFSPQELGLIEQGGALRWPEPLDLLDGEALAVGLPDLAPATFDLIDSTNTRLLKRGEQESVDRCVYLAEFQYGGRGRRGRTWLSPYARNLALSLGMTTSREMSQLGGLSLVVGLAIASELEALGVNDVNLKWPNDVLIGDRKVCGVLVELLQRGRQVEYVVGVGLNVQLSTDEAALIGQPVTDLRAAGVTLARTELAIRVIRAVERHLSFFEREGFAPFVDAFNLVHRYHGKSCSLVQPKGTVTGLAVGIGPSGELLIRTDHGVEAFHSGEVSLRAAPR